MHADFRILSSRLLALCSAITFVQAFYIPGEAGTTVKVWMVYRTASADPDCSRMVDQELRGQRIDSIGGQQGLLRQHPTTIRVL